MGASTTLVAPVRPVTRPVATAVASPVARAVTSPVASPVASPGTRPDTTTRDKTRLAPLWKVILLNDDTTTFDFVIDLLRSLFQKPHDEAVRLTREIHETGSALITRTNREHAELYVEQVRSLARPRGYPLTATIEPD